MPLLLTNTMSQEREVFVPSRPPHVSLYVCGLTVYDEAHLGHARTLVAYDILRRHLESQGFIVHHVMNVTDVDDKILDRARETGEHPLGLARRIERSVESSLEELGLLSPHSSPRVSESIEPILEMIETLIRKGHAYVGQDEHGSSVYFDVRSASDYGKLSRLDMNSLLEGVRKEVAPGKRYPADFALWKAAKPGEISWESPWGRGRPGWHIECSVMSTRAFGGPIDIHGGGWDLIFPHHENELVQTECATGWKPAIRYWVHAGFLTVRGEKMSKSLGNFVTLREALEEWGALTLRLWFSGTHYRSPIDYSEAGLRQSQTLGERLLSLLEDVEEEIPRSSGRRMTSEERGRVERWRGMEESFDSSMDRDLSTPESLAILWEGASLLREDLSRKSHVEVLSTGRDVLLSMAQRLGLPLDRRGYRQPRRPLGVEERLLDVVLAVREELRREGDFRRADRIRSSLEGVGYAIEDTSEGPKARRIR